jgi:hypothetical protein
MYSAFLRGDALTGSMARRLTRITERSKRTVLYSGASSATPTSSNTAMAIPLLALTHQRLTSAHR